MIARINGVEIPEAAVRFELDRLVKFYSEHMSPKELEAQMSLLRQKACEQAIGARLLIDEANSMSVPVDAAEIDARLQVMIENAGGDDAFAVILKKQNLKRELVVDSIAQGLRVDKLVASVTKDVPEPTQEEISAHFEAHRREYRKPERAQAQHILISPDSDAEEDRQVARSRLSEIRECIAEGAAAFADQAAAYSHCPSGQEAGGSLGWVSRGMMVPEFDEVLFSMGVDEVSEIVETSFGFHIICKTAHESDEDVTLEEARERIRDFLIHAARGEAIKAHVDELKKQAVIEIDD